MGPRKSRTNKELKKRQTVVKFLQRVDLNDNLGKMSYQKFKETVDELEKDYNCCSSDLFLSLQDEDELYQNYIDITLVRLEDDKEYEDRIKALKAKEKAKREKKALVKIKREKFERELYIKLKKKFERNGSTLEG